MQQLPLEIFPEEYLLPNKRGVSDYFSIENRRFLGNKFKLVSWIKNVIKENCGKINSICDIFAGTGVVGFYLSNQRNKVIFNDFLRSCTIPIEVFAATTRYDSRLVNEYIEEFNNLDAGEDNYFSINFGGKYFTKEAARKIGAIREIIARANLCKAEKNILLTSLLYAADRIANTVGHYDAYTSSLGRDQFLKLKPLKIYPEKNKNNEVYTEDANVLVRKIEADLLYLDPPYNSRQYSDTYHLLENLVTWKRPEVFGKAAKMNRDHLKSKYCLKSAPEAFKDLINHARCKFIFMSYNNTGTARDHRSNGRITKEQIISTLKERGKVAVFEQEYKEFTAGKSYKRANHKEILFLCKLYQ